MKKYKVRLSIPIEYDTSDLMRNFDAEVMIDAESHEEAVSLGIEEMNENIYLESIYDEIYDSLKTNMLIWLDGDYECDLSDEDYYFVEEQKPMKESENE